MSALLKKNIRTNKDDCHNCGAICCRNLAMEIGRPSNKKEIEDLKWQLQFDTVKVFIRHRRWHQLIDNSKCIYLNRYNRCNIYETRPTKCRKHNPPDCELYGKFYDTMISSPKELDAYLNKGKKKKE